MLQNKTWFFSIRSDSLCERTCSLDRSFYEFHKNTFLAHLRLYCHGWAYSIGRLRCCSSIIWCPHSSNIFSSETSGPVKASMSFREKKFVQMIHVLRPRWPPCPYMVKTLPKSSSPKPASRWPLNWVYSIKDLGPTHFVQMMILGWPWPTLQQGQLCSLTLLYGNCLNTRFYIETIEIYKLKVATNCWLSQYINTWVPEVKVIVWPLSSVTQIYTFKHLLLQSHLAHWSQFHVELFWIVRMKVC